MDGIIIINKEKSWTSNDVVQKIKHVFKEKVGHTGTLDPMATGVLPILVGKGTLLSKYLINHDKEYIATIKLGKKTSTGDIEGDVIAENKVTQNMLETKTVEEVLRKFIGKQEQLPPIYSAIKVNGKKLYEYARKGQEVEIKPRKIEIYNIELISILEEKQEITYKVNCSKGTYIRRLCEDIAQMLGTLGYMKELKRNKVGEFDIKNAILISEIIEIEKIEKNFISIEKFFGKIEKITLNEYKLKLFLNGVKININKQDGLYKIYDEKSNFIGLGISKDGKIKRDIIV